MRKTKLRLLLIALPGILIPLSVALFFFIKAGAWFFVSDPAPSRLDVVFTFAGETARFVYSRELAERFPQAHWVLSDYYHQYSRILSREKFDMSRISAVDTCRYTISEVKGLADWLKSNRHSIPTDTGVQRIAGPRERIDIGLVSNPCHMRRIKCMVEDVSRYDTTLSFHYLPVPAERYGWTEHEIRHWWLSKQLRAWVVFEELKLIKYWLFP